MKAFFVETRRHSEAAPISLKGMRQAEFSVFPNFRYSTGACLSGKFFPCRPGHLRIRLAGMPAGTFFDLAHPILQTRRNRGAEMPKRNQKKPTMVNLKTPITALAAVFATGTMPAIPASPNRMSISCFGTSRSPTKPA